MKRVPHNRNFNVLFEYHLIRQKLPIFVTYVGTERKRATHFINTFLKSVLFKKCLQEMLIKVSPNLVAHKMNFEGEK